MGIILFCRRKNWKLWKLQSYELILIVTRVCFHWEKKKNLLKNIFNVIFLVILTKKKDPKKALPSAETLAYLFSSISDQGTLSQLSKILSFHGI